MRIDLIVSMDLALLDSEGNELSEPVPAWRRDGIVEAAKEAIQVRLFGDGFLHYDISPTAWSITAVPASEED